MFYVTTFIQGGLANQLFQIAAVLHYAKKHGHHPIFPNIYKLPAYTNESRHTYWKLLNSQNNLTLANVNENNFYRYAESSFNYNELTTFNCNVLLFGYYQSFKYADIVKSEMLSLLWSCKKINDIVEELYNNLVKTFKTTDLISIHIRRGDYLKLSAYHTNLTIDYYQKAIDLISNNLPVIVFSNDQKWCRENIPKHISNPKYFMLETEDIENGDYIELLLMSKIKNNIMANSSFSWWASYINLNKDNKIIAPSDWFGPANNNANTDDLYCPNWIII